MNLSAPSKCTCSSRDIPAICLEGFDCQKMAQPQALNGLVKINAEEKLLHARHAQVLKNVAA